MQESLVVLDVNRFFHKYTRFMSKDVYISKKMSDNFFKYYQYLLPELEKNHFLYENQIDYQKVISIFKSHEQVLKLHNRKYLNRTLKSYLCGYNHLVMSITK